MPAPTLALPTLHESDLTRRYLDRVRPTADGTRARLDRLAGLPVAAPDRFLSRPVLLDAAEHRSITADVAGCFRLLVSLPDRLFGGDLGRYATAVGMNAAQADLVLRGAGPAPERFGRVDLYRDATGFRLLEFNVTSALGGMEIAAANRAALAEPAIARFVADEALTFADPLTALVGQLPGLPTRRRPVVALTDWPASWATLEPYLTGLARLMRGYGVDAVACHLGQLEYTADGVRVHDRHVDVVHRFFMPPDYVDGPDAPAAIRRLLTAAEAGAVQLFTPLDSELYGNKAALALLTEHADDDACPPADRALIRRLVPHTAFVRDDEKVADLLRHRAEYVLKPSLLYGGQSIVAGWTVGPREWADHVRAAIGTSTVAQRRVHPVVERHPDESQPLFVNYGVFLTDRGYGGATVRAASDRGAGVVSVASGARPGCVFHARR